MSPSKVADIDWSTFYNVVDGKNRGAKDVTQGVDPNTGKKLWDVPVATQHDLDDAVKAAEKAFRQWSKVPIEKRKEELVRFNELLSQYEQELTDLLCKETGKPRDTGKAEVQGAGMWYSHHASLDLPEHTFEDDEKTVITRYTPLGVCGGICPWNFPLILSSGKIAPALVAGNAIIIKPSPYTPYATLKLVELAQNIFPPGLVQAVGGDDKLGPMMTSHPGISKISFTGSIATGKKIMEACAKSLKRVTLELGGNDASIILPDVDIEKTAPEVAMGAFMNTGQVCVATKRIFIHESIYKPFLEKMVEFTKTIKIGGVDEKDVLLGPIQNSMQYEKVKGFYKDAHDKGYKFAVGPSDVPKGDGFFVQPAIIDNPPTDSKIIQEEPFGPIVPCQPWSDEDEVINRANASNTGLGACVWGKDVEHAKEIGKQLEAGSVWINSYEKPTPQAFFGGHKESGIGGEWGQEGIKAYCNAHVMHVYKS